MEKTQNAAQVSVNTSVKTATDGLRDEFQTKLTEFHTNGTAAA